MNNFLNQIYNLQDKLAVITGAGGHLCSEMARGFLKAGCSVILLDKRLEMLKKTCMMKDLKMFILLN